MVSNKLISEVLVNWGLQREIVSDIVFPETGEISDSAKYVGSNMVIKYTANLGSVKKATRISKALNSVVKLTDAEKKAMTEWIGRNMEKLCIS